MNTKDLSTRFKNVDHISHRKRIKKEVEIRERRGKNYKTPVIKVKALENFRFESDNEVPVKLYKKGWNTCFSEPVMQLPLGHSVPAAEKITFKDF